MAELGSGSYRSGDIANILNFKITSLAPVRSKLIKKGMIYSPAHGELAFTVPLFDEFMVRVIPNFMIVVIWLTCDKFMSQLMTNL